MNFLLEKCIFAELASLYFKDMDIYENYINIGLGAGQQTVAKIRQFEKNYKRFFPADKEAGILDIGPGKGEMLSCLSGLGYANLQAVDISASVECHGFDFLDNSLKSKVQSLMQKCLWFFVRTARKINGTMPNRLLQPVFFAVVRK